MDKVIIDGVDVSECNMKCDNGDCALYYAELNNDNNELIYGFNCSDNEDCYYKQLKRKEQECENYAIQIQVMAQALQEIRDIVSKIIDSYIRPYGDYDNLKHILDKINEVIGAR